MNEPHIPIHLRELNPEQEALLGKLQANYNPDCPALLYHLAKNCPRVIADREKGLVDPVEFIVLMGRSRRPQEMAEKSQPMQFLTGKMSAFQDDGQTLKHTAIAAARLVGPQDPPRQWSRLFRTPEQRRRAFLPTEQRALIVSWDNLPEEAEERRRFVERSFPYCKNAALISFISDEILKGHKAFTPGRVASSLHTALKAKLNDLSPRQMEKLEIPEAVERLSVQDFEFLLDDSKIAFEKSGWPNPRAYGVALIFGFHEAPALALSPAHLRKAIFGAFQHEVPAAVLEAATAIKRDWLEVDMKLKPAEPVPTVPKRDYLYIVKPRFRPAIPWLLPTDVP